MNSLLVLGNSLPHVKTRKQRFRIALMFGVFVFVFLWIFQPFGLAEIQFNKIPIIAGFAFITIVVTVVFTSFRIRSKHPRSIADLIKTSFYITGVISFLNWLYSYTLQCDSIKHSILVYLLDSLAIGLFPVVFLVFYLWMQATKPNTFNKTTENTSTLNASISVKVSKDESLSLTVNKIICAKSSGNYLEIYSENGKSYIKHLIRYPLYKFYNDLENNDFFFHCHKSYIINSKHLIKLRGNAKQKEVLLELLDFWIPISRSFDTTKLNFPYNK